jgi:hypothetical protein
MGRSKDQQDLLNFGKGINTTFPPNAPSARILNPFDFATRLASTMGIKPDGLVQSEEEVEAKEQQQQGQAQQAALTAKVAGPAAGPIAKAAASRLIPGNQQPQPPQQGAQQ